MTTTKMPLNGKEALWLNYFAYLINTLTDPEEPMKKRFNAMGKYWRFKGLAKQASNLYKDLCRTLPEDKLRHFNACLNMQRLYVVTNRAATDPTGDYTVVPRRALLGILSTASKECLLCDGGHEDRRKCPYRRAIKDLCLPDLSKAEDNGVCLGKQFKWEEESNV